MTSIPSRTVRSFGEFAEYIGRHRFQFALLGLLLVVGIVVVIWSYLSGGISGGAEFGVIPAPEFASVPNLSRVNVTTDFRSDTVFPSQARVYKLKNRDLDPQTIATALGLGSSTNATDAYKEWDNENMIMTYFERKDSYYIGSNKPEGFEVEETVGRAVVPEHEVVDLIRGFLERVWDNSLEGWEFTVEAVLDGEEYQVTADMLLETYPVKTDSILPGLIEVRMTRGGNILSVSYRFVEVEAVSATYTLLTPEEASAYLYSANVGMNIAVDDYKLQYEPLSSLVVSSVDLDEVDLAYFLGTRDSLYIQPVYIMQGTSHVQGTSSGIAASTTIVLVPALPPEYLEFLSTEVE